MQHINEDIKTGQLKSVYLLYGEEAYLRKQYRDRLKQAMIGDDTMNYFYHEGKDVVIGEIIDLAETLPFFGEKRLIVLENSGLFKSGGEALAAYLKNRAEFTSFLFVETEIDKRSGLYKTIQSSGYASEFAAQDEATLKKWILGMLKKENKNISSQTLNYLLEKTGTDMENIRQETEKLFCYCMNKDSISMEDIDQICTRQITNQIFDMIGAVAEKKQQKALALYYDLLALKEPPLRILFLVTRQFNLLMQVLELRQMGYNNNSIGSKIGMKPFIVNKYISQSSRFSGEKLREAVNACVETEEAIKTGQINDTLGLELLIIRYSS